MKDVTSLSIDLAKNVFQLHGTDKKGNAVLKKKVSRTKLFEFMVNLNSCNIYMEGCATANYWGREFQKCGHKVKLINPKYVKPYVKRNKNDANDAAAISSASRDPEMRFGEVKTQDQQDMQSMHRFRGLLVRQRTELANQIRGVLSEYGISISQGINNLKTEVKLILAGTADHPHANKLTSELLECLQENHKHLKELDEKVAFYDKKLLSLFKNNEVCQRLETIPGIGVLGATVLASTLGNGGGFKNGRHFAAFLGLTPKQHSSGGKAKLLGISKGGDTYTRTLLIHGARAVLAASSKKNDKLSLWLKRLQIQRGYNKAAVALANKLARIACMVVKEGNKYDLNYKPRFLKAA
ncbi:IS110 family transposase [Candidatus Dependentiae bacterium]|nr:IS110 family transposase [Candidatus Dependentiae bacterium]